MSSKFSERRQIQPWEMTRMESRLEAALRGVDPRPDFVLDLRTRLNKEPVPATSNAQVFQYVIISLAGIVGAVLLLLTGIRALGALLSVLGLLHQAAPRRSDQAQSAV